MPDPAFFRVKDHFGAEVQVEYPGFNWTLYLSLLEPDKGHVVRASLYREEVVELAATLQRMAEEMPDA